MIDRNSIIQNMSKIPELRDRIVFTLLMIIVYRLGSHIPVPGVDSHRLEEIFSNASGVVGFLDMFSGGALQRFSIFALGIMPYINASIIMQLLVYVFPTLERLQKEGGEEGRQKINEYTRYFTVVIGAIQGLGISMMLQNYGVVNNPGWSFILFSIITLTAGTSFIMWLGEQMTQKGIGNGTSILISVGILAGLPGAAIQSYLIFGKDAVSLLTLVAIAIFGYFTICGVVAIQESVRKVPVQYAKRVVGRKVYGGQNTHIPLRVNQAGVIPVIFASSILLFPSMVGNLFQHVSNNEWVMSFFSLFDYNSNFYLLSYALLILFFTYFYTAITFDINQLASNMKKYGGFIPGIRAGRPTVEFLEKTLSRITFAGGVFLAIISLIPQVLIRFFNVPFFFGGTALLIVVGVAMDTIRQMESHLVTRHYEGFMKEKGQ